MENTKQEAPSGDGSMIHHKIVNGHPSDDSAKTDPVGATESIVIDLGNLKESDLIIKTTNDCEVTDEGQKVESDVFQNIAMEMVENALDGANKQISKITSQMSDETGTLGDSKDFEASAGDLLCPDHVSTHNEGEGMFQNMVEDSQTTESELRNRSHLIHSPNQSCEVTKDTLVRVSVAGITSNDDCTLDVCAELPEVQDLKNRQAVNEQATVENLGESLAGNQQNFKESPDCTLESVENTKTEHSTLDGDKESDSQSMELGQNNLEQVSGKDCKKSLQEIKQKSSEEWIDVLGNGMLKKKVIREGVGITTRPVREQEVTVKFVAKLKGSDDIIDSSDALVIVLGEQESLELFDLVCALMQKGEKCLVESGPTYAYGTEGKPPRIPPDATIDFEIELLQINEGPYSSRINIDKRLHWADKKRQEGNKFYSKLKYLEAVTAYTRACKALEKGWLNEESHEGKSRINELRLKCYNNLTVAQMKLLKWKEALQSCIAAEKLDPKNVKTLYRKGKILCEMGELEKGVKYLKKALEYDPENKTVNSELSKQLKKLENQTKRQKRMFQKMLGDIAVKKTGEQPEEKPWFLNNWSRVIGGTLAVGVVLVGIYAAQKL